MSDTSVAAGPPTVTETVTAPPAAEQQPPGPVVQSPVVRDSPPAPTSATVQAPAEGPLMAIPMPGGGYRLVRTYHFPNGTTAFVPEDRARYPGG